MAFSMDRIKSTAKYTDKVYTTNLFGWSKNLENISENAKLVIRLYLDARLFKFGTYGLKEEKYKYMIKDLLKNCCGKEFIDITPQDTDNNIKEIAFQVKWAIQRYEKDKRTLNRKTIYIDRDKELILDKVSDNKPPKRIQYNTISDRDLQEYLESMRVE